MTLPLTTAMAAAVIAVLQVVLMLAVGLKRQASGVSLGDGGDQELLRRMRRHGNLIENAPMFLILLMLLEIIGGTPSIVLIFAGLFVLARLSHAISLSSEGAPLALRAIGAMGTILSLLGTAGMLIWQLSGIG